MDRAIGDEVVNLEQGYGLIEIRTPREVLADEEGI
jgi:hypothetical protein